MIYASYEVINSWSMDPHIFHTEALNPRIPLLKTMLNSGHCINSFRGLQRMSFQHLEHDRRPFWWCFRCLGHLKISLVIKCSISLLLLHFMLIWWSRLRRKRRMQPCLVLHPHTVLFVFYMGRLFFVVGGDRIFSEGWLLHGQLLLLGGDMLNNKHGLMYLWASRSEELVSGFCFWKTKYRNASKFQMLQVTFSHLMLGKSDGLIVPCSVSAWCTSLPHE